MKIKTPAESVPGLRERLETLAGLLMTDEDLESVLIRASDSELEELLGAIPSEAEAVVLAACEAEEGIGVLEAVKRVVRHGRVVIKTIRRIPPQLRNKLKMAARKSARKRRGRHLPMAARRAISRSMHRRATLGMRT